MPAHEGTLSKNISSSASITTAGKAGLLYAYCLQGGTSASSVTFSDGGSGGTVRWIDSVKAQTAAGDATVSMVFTPPLAFTTDIYCTIAGTSATVSVAYIQTK